MPPLQGFVNEVRKGWMPPPSDFANFGKEIYSVAETLSSCSFIPCGTFYSINQSTSFICLLNITKIKKYST